jgi:hypothetical protein
MQAIEDYDGTTRHAERLQAAIDDYSAFITNTNNQLYWSELSFMDHETLQPLAAQLRDTSARCVSIMEKYRALKLLNGEDDDREYFKNIETSIEKEFGSFTVSARSKVLLIGSGAFPMTPLLIAGRTGAEVTGIDIDGEALALGRRVTERLGPHLPIRQEHLSLEQLHNISEMTHIIISSTVSVKYELLDRLHAVAGPDVVVAIRYGNGLKSLFNYPMEATDERKWQLAETAIRPEHVFDVALYRKALTPVPARGDC